MVADLSHALSTFPSTHLRSKWGGTQPSNGVINMGTSEFHRLWRYWMCHVSLSCWLPQPIIMTRNNYNFRRIGLVFIAQEKYNDYTKSLHHGCQCTYWMRLRLYVSVSRYYFLSIFIRKLRLLIIVSYVPCINTIRLLQCITVHCMHANR